MLVWIKNFFTLLIVGVLGLAVLLPLLRHQKRSWIYLGVFSVFWVYLLAVVGITLLPKPNEVVGIERLPIREILSKVHLLPFYAGKASKNVLLNQERIGNLLIMIPLGFLVPLLARPRRGNFPWFVLIVGAGFETAQLVISLIIGWDYRVVDITDVIMNTAGAVVGYGVFLAGRWLYKAGEKVDYRV